MWSRLKENVEEDEVYNSNNCIDVPNADQAHVEIIEVFGPSTSTSTLSSNPRPRKPAKRLKQIASKTLDKLNVFRKCTEAREVPQQEHTEVQVQESVESQVKPPGWFVQFTAHFTLQGFSSPALVAPDKKKPISKDTNSNNYQFICNSCQKIVCASVSSSWNLKRHLKIDHKEIKLEPIGLHHTDTVVQPELRDVTEHNILTSEQLNKKVLKTLISGLLAYDFVENADFRELIYGLQTGKAKKLNLMHRRQIMDLQSKVMDDHIKARAADFETIQYFSATADCWKQNKKAFLGVTLHWLTEDGVRKMAVIACRRLKTSITYSVLANELYNIFKTYGVHNKLLCVTTDNGSNFVKAFRIFGQNEIVTTVLEDDDEDFEVVELEPILGNGLPLDDPEGWNLPEHIRCSAHKLNLIGNTDVEKCFNSKETTYINFQNAFEKCLKKCKMLWNRQNSDPIHSVAIENEIGKQLITPNATRWNSTFDSLKFLTTLPVLYYEKHPSENLQLSISNVMNRIYPKINLQSCKFEATDEAFLLEYCKVMHPLAIALDKLQSSKQESEMGYLLPVIHTLRRKLQEYLNEEFVFCKPLAQILLTSIENRFGDDLEKQNFIIASCIHPKFYFNWVKDDLNLKKNVPMRLTAYLFNVLAQNH